VFLARVTESYPTFYPSGFPNDVIDAWYLSLKNVMPEGGRLALVRYIAENGGSRKPTAKSIAKLVLKSYVSYAQTAYTWRKDENCPRCGGCETISCMTEDGSYYVIDCICRGLRIGAPNAAIRKGNEIYLRLLSAGQLVSLPENRLLAREYFKQSDGEDLPY
jgi:hypothetical protein